MGQLYSSPPPMPTDGWLRSYNPATEEELGKVPLADESSIAEAMKRARTAQQAWGALSVEARCRQLKAFRNVLVRHTTELCQWISEETGKPTTEALLHEVAVVIDSATYFIRRAPSILAEETIPLHLLKNRKSYLRYAPRGVVGIISPWNFPFALPMCEAIMALIAGNAVLLKPSEITPLIAEKTKALFDQSGLPADLFQVVHGFGDTGAALLQSGIDYCIFTGSTHTGRRVAAACGERLIPCVLELGGKTPALVCEDADIARTARALVWGAFTNSGQVCVSIERAYVPKSLYDVLLAAIVQETLALRQGNPQQAEVDLGSMTWARQRQHVHQLVQQAVSQGAQVLTGGVMPTGPGLYYPPTVLGACTPSMEIVKNEIFGPVLPLIPVEDEAEGVRLSNDSPFGLMAYVFSKKNKKSRQLAERLVAGTVMRNDALISFAAPETPWGGVKHSGVGRTHSAQGLKDLCQVRHINLDRFQLLREPWWYPYRNRWLTKAHAFLRVWFR